MDFSELMSIEALGWLLMLFGWVSQMYLAYAKRSTRISKRALFFILLGLVALVISRWVVSGFGLVAGLQLGSVLLAWLVYIRRR